MRYLVLVFILLIGISVQSASKDKEAKAKEVKELIESQQFRFIAQTALPRSGSSNELPRRRAAGYRNPLKRGLVGHPCADLYILAPNLAPSHILK